VPPIVSVPDMPLGISVFHKVKLHCHQHESVLQGVAGLIFSPQALYAMNMTSSEMF
jgi:hypothetical protein